MAGASDRVMQSTSDRASGPPRAPMPSASIAAQANDGAVAALKALLKLEAAIRQTKDETELAFLLANEMRALTRSRQVFVVKLPPRGEPETMTISGLAAIDRNVALVQTIERGLSGLRQQGELHRRHEFRLSGLASPGNAAAAAYPLQEMVWLPLLANDGRPCGGCLLAREIPWTDGDIAVAEHIAGSAAFAWRALNGGRPMRRRLRIGRKVVLACTAVVAVLCFVPIPMTVLAPAEVSAQNAFVVTAGLPGEIAEVLVTSNAPVKAGDVVVRLAQIEARNRLEVAEREVAVAAAKLQKANQLAFVDIRGRHDMALARAELDLKLAERNYAKDQFAKTELRAGRDGVAVIGDRKDLVGRPVAIGDRILEIADPEAIELSIDVPVGDAIVIKPGARVKVFLDTDPLNPVEALVSSADYQARPRDASTLAYRVTAQLGNQAATLPRLGVRGTAQVYGETAPLWFYLFRKPLSALRQWTGI